MSSTLKGRDSVFRNNHTLQDYLLFAEGMLLITFMALAIQLLPFRWIKVIASLKFGEKTVNRAGEDNLLCRVRWAIPAAARRSPGRAKCFEQGLAAQLMLRRRGINSSLFYGLATDKGEPLAAHVWVKVGDIAICGTANASDFAELLCLPNGSGST